MTFQSIPITLIIMYLLLIPCVVLYMRFKFGKRGVFATIFKGLATWVILAGALFSVQGTVVSMFSALIIAGLAMGLAGDIALSLPKPGFTSGMLFFGLGHVCYITAMVLISERVIYVIPAFIVLFSLYLLIYRKLGIAPPKILRIPIIAYSAIVACMLSFAATMPFSEFPKGLVLLFSGVLFATSDIMLAYNRFPAAKTRKMDKKANNRLGIVSLICYFLAQSLFAVSVYLYK